MPLKGINFESYLTKLLRNFQHQGKLTPSNENGDIFDKAKEKVKITFTRSTEGSGDVDDALPKILVSPCLSIGISSQPTIRSGSPN
jgi:hypothetical protein